MAQPESAPGPTVLVERSERIATVILNRPEVLNAITPAMIDELAAVLADVAADPEIAVVVLTGAGKAFSAGVDLKSLGDRSLVGGSVGDILDVPARAAVHWLTTMAKVVIAKVNGPCFTGALELVLACDIVVAADTAKMGDTHAKWGLRPTWGMSQRLIRSVGPARARWLSYTARTFTGRQAADWGLAAVAVAQDNLDATVAELAATIVSNSGGSIAAFKDLYAHSLDVGLSEGLDYEAATSYPIEDTEDRIGGFR
jgi:enoyl-CoA hydratase